MGELPVTIRLLDPPLHEFLPKTEEEMREVAGATSKDIAAIRQRAIALHEANPMLGHRGVRLAITSPEIYDMQVRAIFEAAAQVAAGYRANDQARDHDSAGGDKERGRSDQGVDRPYRRPRSRKARDAPCPISSVP